MGARPSRTALLGLVLLVAVHVLIAWFPFRLDVPGYVPVEVERLDSGGLELGGRRIVAQGPAPWDGADLDGIEAVVADLLVRPAETFQFGPARILSSSDGYTAANIMIGQERDNLVVRVRREGSDPAGSPPLVVPRAFTAGRWARIQVVVGRRGVLAAVEGVGRQEVAVDRAPMPAWDPTYPVLVGDERPGSRVWHGQVGEAVLSADGRALDYLAPGTLEIPEHTWYVPDRLWEALEPPDLNAQIRSVLHLLAFVPFGALLAVVRRRLAGGPGEPRSARLLDVAVPVAAFAVVLQLGKVVLDGRHPSALTVLAQVAGALAGAVLLHWLGARALRDQADRRTLPGDQPAT